MYVWYVCMYKCVLVYVHACVYYACVYACLCICVEVRVYVYIYIYVCMRITHYDAFKILNPATHKKHFKHYHSLTVKKKKNNNKNVLISCMIQY